jgi:hypothetical protein
MSLPARADTTLADLDGEWRGTGNDRVQPGHLFQQTTCRNSVHATAREVTSELTCEGRTGLRRVIRMVAAVQGDRFSGRVKQSVQMLGKPPLELAGSLAGHRVKDTVTFPIRWTGPWPDAIVAFKLLSPVSYSMHVGSMGYTIIEVVFKRDEASAAAASARAEAAPGKPD